uniref:HVA22-like protein n=1 Tax=Rhizophora mucronata TaxID=61149 RepID=A0A2P2KIC4_RHIMU
MLSKQVEQFPRNSMLYGQGRWNSVGKGAIATQPRLGMP